MKNFVFFTRKKLQPKPSKISVSFNQLNKKHFNSKVFAFKESNNFDSALTLEYSLDNYHRSNQDTCLVHKPCVSEGQWVQSGDLLADCSTSVGGELSLGQNVLIAYMPWEGYNFEDAILVSERLVYDDLYTSIHIEAYEAEIRETKLGMEEITAEIPGEESNNHLNQWGIAKLGSWVQEGDILVGKVTPINKKNQSNYQKLLYTILEKPVLPFKDSSLRAPKGMNAKVVGIQIFKNNKHKILIKNDTQKNFLKTKGFNLKSPIKSSLNTNDFAQHYNQNHLTKTNSEIMFYENKNQNKIRSFSFKSPKPSSQSNLNNQKLVVTLLTQNFSSIKENFSYLNSKNVSNKKLGKLASRFSKNVLNKQLNCNKNKSYLKIRNSGSLKNVSSIQIYLAEKRRIQVGDKMAGRHGNKGIISQILPREDMPFLPDGTPLDIVLNPLGVPSRMNVGQIYECLLGLAGKYLGENFKVFPFDEIYGAEASRSFVYSKLYEAKNKTKKDWLFNPNSPGKMRLYDGRTGETFYQPITVGYAYMIRLVHMVDDKIHARSTGPYSLVTQQPLRGRSKQGGQRLGEMEVWALEGYGAAFTLLEMLTIKSDDMTGRMTLWSNLMLNKEISIGTPESFKVLICELQALCLDIELVKPNEKITYKNLI